MMHQMFEIIGVSWYDGKCRWNVYVLSRTASKMLNQTVATIYSNYQLACHENWSFDPYTFCHIKERVLFA